jgi:hypothetical protein
MRAFVFCDELQDAQRLGDEGRSLGFLQWAGFNGFMVKEGTEVNPRQRT